MKGRWEDCIHVLGSPGRLQEEYDSGSGEEVRCEARIFANLIYLPNVKTAKPFHFFLPAEIYGSADEGKSGQKKGCSM